MREPGFRVTGRLVVGLVIITVGVLFTLDNLGVLDSSRVLRWWPALLLVYGLLRLTGFCCYRHRVIGGVLTFLGGWLLLERLNVVHRSPAEFWPAVLVVVGVAMVTSALSRSKGEGESGSPTIHAFALWSGSGRKVVAQDFRGGEITAIMGGHDIDLRPAKMDGTSAVIDLFVWWGGVDLRVPPDWKVSNEALALMGGVDDTSHAPEGECKGVLVLKGLIVMGGVEVRN